MTATVSLAAAVALAAVFAVAAGAKLADPSGMRNAVVAFGAPKRLAAAISVALVVAELTVAALLLPAATATAGAAGALVLLGIFSIAIGVGLARGRTPECHCFGQLHSAPAGWKTLSRNAALAVIAAVALAGGVTGTRPSAVGWLGRLDGAAAIALAAGLACAAVAAVAAVAALSLLRSYGHVLVRLERIERLLVDNGLSLDEDLEPQQGLPPGSPAPAAPALTALLERGKPLLLLFTSVRCGPCRALLPEAAAWQVEHGDVLTIAFATEGAADEVRAEAAEHELENVLADERLELYEAFAAAGTPSAVLIAPDGTVSSWLAAGADRIRDLLALAVAPEPGLPVGSALPALRLPTLDGRLVGLEDLRGRSSLVVFWNPACGYCRAMHDDLVQWERSTNGSDPRLVVVSSGDAESSRHEGFESLVLLDDDFSVGAALGATGTPSALLVDADMTVASSVAVGADAVLALGRTAASASR